MSSAIFAPASPLPRGPHGLSREEVSSSQRTRLMAALAGLVAERGYAGATIGDLARRAGVSRAAFYQHFSDKEECLLAAYEHFAATLLEAMTAGLSQETPWETFIATALGGYLRTLEREPEIARAFIVEMDAAGTAARARRRAAMHGFAAMIAERHAAFRRLDPSLGPLPASAYAGIAFAVRELVRERLEDERRPRLRELEPEIIAWLRAMIEGAAKT